jgi:hypothetical protein
MLDRLCELTGRDPAGVRAQIARDEGRHYDPLPTGPMVWEAPPRVGTLAEQEDIIHRRLTPQQRREVEALIDAKLAEFVRGLQSGGSAP